MKIVSALAVGAALGFGIGFAIDNGMGKWVALAAFLITASVLFVEYFTRPGIKRGR